MNGVPELPEVETVVRGLRPALEGRRLARVTPRRANLRTPLPEDLGQRLAGATVTAVDRRAKYGLIRTDRGDTLIFHLGMTGTMRLNPTELRPHDHVLFETDAGSVHFHDPRRFGMMDLARTADEGAHKWLALLGPEPLGGGFTGAHLHARGRGRAVPVKALLMDQRVVAGVGNIYASEALHRAGIAPGRAAGRIAAKRYDALADATREVLSEAIGAGGSSLRDHAQVNGEPGMFQAAWRVYGRAGEPCGACGGPVARTVHAGRSTFHCARCQT